MGKLKVNLTRAQLLKLLQEKNFCKERVAESLGVSESAIRRACKRHKVVVQQERKAMIPKQTIPKFMSKQTGSSHTPNIGTFLVYPDLHANTVNWEALNLVCQFAQDFKPEYVIQIGDWMDYLCLMSKIKSKYPSFDCEDLRSLQLEYEACSKQRSMINQVLPQGCKKVYQLGNHEHRATMLMKAHPELTSILDMETHLDLRGWTIIPYLQRFKLGKLNFIHGEFFGASHVQKHLRHYQKNVLYGHTHGIQQDTMASPMREIPTWGASIGCLCDVNPDYQRNKSNQWQHGFAYGWFDKNSGDFDVMIKRIIHGKFWAEGRRYCI